MTIRLSLVLATYGRSDDIGRFVTGLEKQLVRDFELLVIDQNSDDRVVPYVLQALNAGLQVQHYRLQSPNLSAARNLGVSHAQGEVIGFPDDDCWYEPELVQSVLKAFEVRSDLGGLVAEWVEQAQARLDSPLDPLLSNERWRRFHDGDASSISLFLRTDLLRQVGGFDARLGVGQWFGAGEETDLILTLLATGAKLARYPSARVHHHFLAAEQKLSSGSWKSTLRRARGTGALYAKHRLGLWVFVRGLCAPPAKALAARRGGLGLRFAMATSVGRLQGALAWLIGWRT